MVHNTGRALLSKNVGDLKKLKLKLSPEIAVINVLLQASVVHGLRKTKFKATCYSYLMFDEDCTARSYIVFATCCDHCVQHKVAS